MMNVRNLCTALVVICLAALSVVPAYAAEPAEPPTPPPWVPYGWTYFYTCQTVDGGFLSEGTHLWWLPPEIIDWLEQHPDSIWFFTGEEFGRCHYPPPATQVNLVPGETHDIWYNQCGVYIPVAPAGGVAALKHTSADQLNFSQRPCQLSFTNQAGIAVSNFGVSATYYFNLDRVQYEQYLAGELGFYTNDGSGWTECAASLVGADPANQEYGRLACTSTSVLAFSLVVK